MCAVDAHTDWISAITVAGKSVTLSTGDAALSAIDTGTTLIGGPAADVRNFWANVQGSQALSGQNKGYYSYRTIPFSHRLSHFRTDVIP